jgi:hypothetical protein
MPTLILTLVKLIPIRWAVYAAALAGLYLWHAHAVREAYQRGKTEERAAFVEDAHRRITNALEEERRARGGLPAPGGVPDNDGHRRD